MLDKLERDTVRFYDTNGLIDDAMAAERERKLANPWTDEEKKIFIEKYLSLLSLSTLLCKLRLSRALTVSSSCSLCGVAAGI